jgi:hypothetical protein
MRLSHNCLSILPRELGKMRGLTHLDLGGNRVGSFPYDFRYVCGFNRLKSCSTASHAWCWSKVEIRNVREAGYSTCILEIHMCSLSIPYAEESK